MEAIASCCKWENAEGSLESALLLTACELVGAAGRGGKAGGRGGPSSSSNASNRKSMALRGAGQAFSIRVFMLTQKHAQTTVWFKV